MTLLDKRLTWTPVQVALDRLRAASKRWGVPIVVFDLEATQKSLNFGGFRITEFAMVVIQGEEPVVAASHLVNPEMHIPKKVVELTGINDLMVAHMPAWSAWVDLFHALASRSVSAGFNSAVYDCGAVLKMNAKFGQSNTLFNRHLDVRELPGAEGGTLSAVALCHGVAPDGAFHRALPDALATAQLLDLLLPEGLALDKIQPAPRPGPVGTRAERLAAVLTAYEHNPRMSNTEREALASTIGVKPSTIEGYLGELALTGALPVHLFITPDRLQTLTPLIEQAKQATWQSPETQGQHKLLIEWMQSRVQPAPTYAEITFVLNIAATSGKPKPRKG